MSAITHHLPDHLVQAYVAGRLPHGFSMVVACHVSMCAQCRATLEAHEAVGGLLLEEQTEVGLSAGMRDRMMDALMAEIETPITLPPAPKRRGIFPGPLAEHLPSDGPRWRTLGMGVRQSLLSADKESSLRLLHIPAGVAVPDHGHNGIELTLVLQGSFSDETGRFGVGDVEVADESLEHTPVADPGEPCICLAATDAPLRFMSLMPRLLQPLFRI